MHKYRLPVLLALFTIKAAAQTETLTSRFYFPALIGVNLHLYEQHQHYGNGLVLNTAMEYRPGPQSFFYRFNYDGVNSAYRSDALQYSPTNVKTGSLSIKYFMAGFGDRKRTKETGWYWLLQTGLEQRSYDHVSGNPEGYGINQVNKNQLAFKITGGYEYYLAPHFALITEPAFYPGAFDHRPLFSGGNFTWGIGFTTTLF